jgi:hypothetical protein
MRITDQTQKIKYDKEGIGITEMMILALHHKILYAIVCGLIFINVDGRMILKLIQTYKINY